MAHFRATIRGNRGPVSRLGTKRSGIIALLDGWDIGVRVELIYDETRHRDMIVIHKTSGSSSSYQTKLIGRFMIPPGQERTHQHD